MNGTFVCTPERIGTTHAHSNIMGMCCSIRTEGTRIERPQLILRYAATFTVFIKLHEFDTMLYLNCVSLSRIHFCSRADACLYTKKVRRGYTRHGGHMQWCQAKKQAGFPNSSTVITRMFLPQDASGANSVVIVDQQGHTDSLIYSIVLKQK